MTSDHESFDPYDKSELNSINSDLDCVLLNNKHKNKSKS